MLLTLHSFGRWRRRNFLPCLLLLCLALLLFASFDGVNAKKGRKRRKRRPKKNAKSKNNAEKTAAGRAGGIRKTLTDADLQAIEDAWLADEDDDPDDPSFKWTRTEQGDRRPPEQRGPKTEMSFVSLQEDTPEKMTDRLAARWAEMLYSGGVAIKAYKIEPTKILIVTDNLGWKDMIRVRNFVLRQPEVVEFEWNQKKFTADDIQDEDEL